MEGELGHCQGLLNMAKPRYCVLNNEVLTLYNHKGGDIRARIHMGVFSIKSDNNKKSITLDNGLQQIELRLSALSSTVLWANQLKEAKKRFMDRIINRGSPSKQVPEPENTIAEKELKELQEAVDNPELKTKLDDVWANQAILTEVLNELFMKIPNHDPFVKTAELLDELGTDLKVRAI